MFTQEISDQLRALLDGQVTLEQIDEAKRVEAAKADTKAQAAAKQDRRDRDDDLAGRGFKSSGFKSSFKRIGNIEQEAEDLMNEVMAAGGVDENEDGEPMEMEEDLDGEPMGDDLDGEPMDLDGEPL